jgi:hypothetical protein
MEILKLRIVGNHKNFYTKTATGPADAIGGTAAEGKNP